MNPTHSNQGASPGAGPGGGDAPPARIGCGCFQATAFWLGVMACFLGSPARAQWFETTFALKGGWNAIYLHGDATHAPPDVLFPDRDQTAGILEVWRWNPKSSQVQFTTSPLIPSAGTPEWNAWVRGNPAVSTLSLLPGQTAYLVKCSGSPATTWNVPLVQRAMPPAAVWVRAGANLLGFPTRLTPASNAYPTFATYFRSFPAATASDAKIYKYTGGELGPSNPLQIFSPAIEQVDRTKAFWFEAEVVGNFSAPLDVSLSQDSGLDFGRTGSVVTARLRNTTSSTMTVTVAPVLSHAAPPGQDAVAGPVPLTRRVFNAAAASWTESPIADQGYIEVIGPNSTVELGFGVTRSAMGGASNTLYASLLRLTDSENRFDINLPVSARVASLAGLWIGDATITHVSSQVQTTATAKAVLTDGVLTGIEVTGGGFGYGSMPVPVIASPDGLQATATATLSPDDGSVSGLTLTSPGSGYAIAPAITFSAPASGTTAAAVATVKNGILTGVAITHAGSGYATPPVVTVAAPANAVTEAAAAASVDAGRVVAVSVTSPGLGYFTPPSITISPPESGTTAQAVAEVKNGALTGVTVTVPGSGYRKSQPPVITIGAPSARTAASATAIVQNGKVTGFEITNGGSGYLAAPSITIPNPVAAGTVTLRTPPLRLILHVDDAGTARLLSQVFVGTIAANGAPGLCTRESLLRESDKSGALRFVAAHLPLDRVLASGSGVVALGQTLVRTVSIPFDDETNPFVHTYHPDHNNKDARGMPIAAGVESHGINRTLQFEFTTMPPPGVTASGWGSAFLGGRYQETIRGLHKQDLIVSGTFVLRRASENGTLTQP